MIEDEYSKSKLEQSSSTPAGDKDIVLALLSFSESVVLAKKRHQRCIKKIRNPLCHFSNLLIVHNML